MALWRTELKFWRILKNQRHYLENTTHNSIKTNKEVAFRHTTAPSQNRECLATQYCGKGLECHELNMLMQKDVNTVLAVLTAEPPEAYGICSRVLQFKKDE